MKWVMIISDRRIIYICIYRCTTQIYKMSLIKEFFEGESIHRDKILRARAQRGVLFCWHWLSGKVGVGKRAFSCLPSIL